MSLGWSHSSFRDETRPQSSSWDLTRLSSFLPSASKTTPRSKSTSGESSLLPFFVVLRSSSCPLARFQNRPLPLLRRQLPREEVRRLLLGYGSQGPSSLRGTSLFLTLLLPRSFSKAHDASPSLSLPSPSARRLHDRSRSCPRSSDRGADVLRGRPSQREPKQPDKLVNSQPRRSRRREGRSSCWSRRRRIVDEWRERDGSSSRFGFGKSIGNTGGRGGWKEIWLCGWVDDGGSLVESSERKRRSATAAAAEAFAGRSYEWRGS